MTIVEINFYDFGLLRINILEIHKNQQKIAFNKLFFRNYLSNISFPYQF